MSHAGAARREPVHPIRYLPWFTEVVFAIFAVALVQTFVVKPFSVPSQSMEDTLHVGDRILVNRMDTSLARGDIVVFEHGATWQDRRLPLADSVAERAVRKAGDILQIGPNNVSYTVKRLIGLPGERVACCSAEGAVTVDGRALTEPYVLQDYPFVPGALDCDSTPRSARCFPEVTVPSRNLLVLGDHRSRSGDSVIGCRAATQDVGCASFVPRTRVVGPVVVRFWPVGDIGGIPR